MALAFGSKAPDRGAARPPWVVATLSRLVAARRFVEVRFDGDRRVHQSIILKVAPEANLLAIDELFPNDDGTQGRPGQRCTVTAIENGVRVRFTTRVIDAVAASSGRYYRLAMPDDVERHERRGAFRVDLGRRGDFEATLVLPDGRSLAAGVRNLSATGVGLVVDGDFTSVLDRGLHLDGCTLRLGDALEITCGLEVRGVGAERDPRPHTAVGARFRDLPAETVRAIERLLMAEQRELRKRGI